MKEELITYETAVLAKERGFDEECFNHYVKNNKYSKPFGLEENYYVTKVVYKKNSCLPYKTPSPYSEIQECTAPTQSLLQRWLREVHNILVEPTHYTASHFTYKLYKRDKVIEILFLGGVNEIFHTYEQALEKGLLEALKLIK